MKYIKFKFDTVTAYLHRPSTVWILGEHFFSSNKNKTKYMYRITEKIKIITAKHVK